MNRLGLGGSSKSGNEASPSRKKKTNNDAQQQQQQRTSSSSKSNREPALMNLPPSLTQQQPIYRTPFYVEEASLYSIAEDSREDRASEITSRAGTISTVSTPVSVRHERLSLQPGESPTSSSTNRGPILTDWSLDMDEENWGLRDERITNSSSRSAYDNTLVGAAKQSRWLPPDAPSSSSHVFGDEGEESSSRPSDDGTYPMSLESHGSQAKRTRKVMIYASLVAVVMASVIVTISIALLNKSSSGDRGVVSDGLAVGDAGGGSASGNSTAVPTTLAPTAAPTPPPTITYPAQVKTVEEQQVYSALSTCSEVVLEEALDGSTVQNQVYQQLVAEAQGTSMGEEELIERWALILLFIFANGEYWKDSASWFHIDKDVCNWGEGTISCDSRVGGKAAVTGLHLSGNNMYGVVPKELCCLPKLQQLDLSNNFLTSFPDCLQQMNLGSFDVSGNP